MRIRQIPILQDNYSHLVIDDERGVAAVIDPAEPPTVLQVIADEGVQLTHILCTHHHWDHAGGNRGMLEIWPDAEVVASEADAPRVEGVTSVVGDGDVVRVGEMEARILFVPCHTRGHVAYLFGDALFCGDTLFVAGCGRFFEGDAGEMHTALNDVFASLPPGTRVYCGHEYTVSNLRFALHVEPENSAAREKMAWAEEQRKKGLSTVPSTIAEELSFNPFMRVGEASVSAAVDATNPVDVMRRLRELKNSF